MIILDATVVIAYLDADHAHHHEAVAILQWAAESDRALGIGTITLAEVLVKAVQEDALARTMAILRELEIREIMLPDHAAEDLAKLRVRTRLKMPDCTVLAVAQAHVAAIATFDRRLATMAADGGCEVCGLATSD